MARRISLLGLFRSLKGDTRTLIRQEMQLAKTEISEKISHLGRNAATLAIGGFVAYAGLLVFLIGLGYLLAWAFEQAGLAPVFAGFVGLAAIGLLVSGVGCALLLKALKTFSKESITPERTIHTLQELKGSAPVSEPQAQVGSAPSPSSEEMQNRVEATESRLGETLGELGHRLSPQHINEQIKQRIQAKPYRSGLIAVGAGMVSGLLLHRRFRRA